LTSPDRILWCTDERFPRLLQGTLGDGDKIEAIESFAIMFLPAPTIALYCDDDVDNLADLFIIDPPLAIVL